MKSFASQISFVLLFLLFATTFNRSMCHTDKEVRCNENDQKILSIFKQGVVDSSNLLSSWTRQEDCCSWEGVYCDNITGRVRELRLNLLGLQGEINLSLLQLEFINYLDLSINDFTSVCIPPCQALRSTYSKRSYNQSLAIPFNQSTKFSASLQYLDFSENEQLTIYDLHWLSQLSSLKYLNLSNVDIGNETKWLQYMAMLPSLSELHLAGCGLRNFPFLNYVNFTSLVTLDLSDNRINSKLSDSFFNFTSGISHLDLSINYLYRQLPVTLFKLQNLKSLRVSDNMLKGSIPNWLGQHEHLQEFDISYNLFFGSIPSSLGNISSLTSLDLSYNQLTGNLPISLGQLQNLNVLSIRANSLVGVLSEKNFANLSRLSDLDASSNGFRSSFDPNWVPAFQLEFLDLGNTSLGPNLPAWIYSQRSLATLYIYESGISTVDVDVFWNYAARIDEVDLSNNLIDGDISNVTINSSFIDLSYNNFSGSLPQLSTNVKSFRASRNSFSGSPSSLLCHPKSNEENKLSFLDLSYNHLSGALADCWANWKQLTYLNLGSNMLTGEVPPSMASLMNLQTLILTDNSFFGKFSLNMSNWKNLEYLLLEKNNFSGSLPNTLQQNLMVIKLRANQFIGNILSQMCNLSYLRILDLSHNNLSGSIPHCLYNIMHSNPTYFSILDDVHLFTKGREVEYKYDYVFLTIIDFSNNILSGEISKELFNLTEMWSLNLSRNHLTGKIPKEVGGMKSLESLDLSYNRLSGEIPSTISNLSFLNHLNLSYNNFNGQIPLGTQIQSFDYWSFVGNPKLCGDPLPTKCDKKEETHDSKPVEGNEDNNFLNSLYLGMGVGFAAGFLGVCGSLFLNRLWFNIRKKFPLSGYIIFLVLNKAFQLQRGSFAAMLPIELSFVILNLVNSTESRTCRGARAYALVNREIGGVLHALGDGISLMSMFLVNCRKVDDPEALPTIVSFDRKKSSRWDWRKLWGFVVTLRFCVIFSIEFV
ncbi:hypothetical protein K1719_026340 [Acacia pycnantha]|nr:hypothetical protein K1719_026340 [Acacia pycnantha]